MIPTKTVTYYMWSKDAQVLANDIQREINEKGVIAVDPFCPFFAEGKYHVILVLTLEDVSDERPQRYR